MRELSPPSGARNGRFSPSHLSGEVQVPTKPLGRPLTLPARSMCSRPAYLMGSLPSVFFSSSHLLMPLSPFRNPPFTSSTVFTVGSFLTFTKRCNIYKTFLGDLCQIVAPLGEDCVCSSTSLAVLSYLPYKVMMFYEYLFSHHLIFCVLGRSIRPGLCPDFLEARLA